MPGAQISSRAMVPRRATVEGAGRARDRFLGAHIAPRARPLAARGVGQILDAAVDIFVKRLAICMGIAALLMVPIQLASEFIARSNIPLEFQGLLIGVFDMAALPVQFVTSGFVCVVVGGELMGYDVTASDALRVALRRIIGICVIAVITFFAAMILVCPCGITTYLGYWLFAVVPAVYVLEGVGLGDAIGRGLRLVWGLKSFGRWLAWYLVATILVVPATSLWELRTNEFTRGYVLDLLPSQLGLFGFFLALLEAVFIGGALAFPAVVMVVYYVDLRVRREGLDLEHRLARLQARSGEGVR